MKKFRVEKTSIPSPGGPMKLIILKPARRIAKAGSPGILWIHGGGYATGMAGMVYASRAMTLVKKYGAVVISPQYRLSGKHPYPAALEDCYAALQYLHKNTEDLGVNPRQIMVGGESAGGGLTAAMCMYARDRGEIPIACQMPLYPMLDNRDTPSSENCKGISWNTRRNHAAWKMYLRSVEGEPSAYAVPARQLDYTRLPPCYTFVGDKEPFYCETLTYVKNLQNAGVEARADVYPSGFHAFDMLLPFLKKSRQAAAAFETWFHQTAMYYYSDKE